MAASNLKITILLLVSFFIHSALFAQQNVPILERKISININTESPESVLHQIEEKANFTFSYDPRLLEGKKIEKGNFVNVSIREILHSLFSDRLRFKENGKHIIILKGNVNESSVPQYYLISGYVSDGISGNQIAQVSIYEKKSRESAVSNEYGYFKLKVKKEEVPGKLQLTVNKATYKDTIVYVSQAGNSLLNISLYPLEEMKPSIDSLSIQDSLMRVDQLAFVNLLLSKEEKINTVNVRDTIYRKFQASFLPYLGSNLRLSGNTVNDFSLNVLGGYSMGTRILEIGGLFNIERDSVSYVQIAGLTNIVGGPVTGTQIGGLVNYDLKPVTGAQVSGFMNMSRDTVTGFQAAGFMNLNTKFLRGFSTAGFLNMQMADMTGCQVAGFMNTATDHFRGAQIAGFLNVSTNELSGSQISGFMNYGSKVHGTQIGFLNIADSVGGVPIGFLSFVRQGVHQLEISANEIFPVNVSLRTGVPALYNIVDAGMKVDSVNANDIIWDFGYGLGSSVHLGKKWRLDFDLTVHQPLRGNEIHNFNPLGRLNLTIEKRFTKFFTLAAGPSINTFFYKTNDPLFTEVLDQLAPASAFSFRSPDGYKNVSWFGGKVAVRFF